MPVVQSFCTTVVAVENVSAVRQVLRELVFLRDAHAYEPSVLLGQRTNRICFLFVSPASVNSSACEKCIGFYERLLALSAVYLNAASHVLLYRIRSLYHASAALVQGWENVQRGLVARDTFFYLDGEKMVS